MRGEGRVKATFIIPLHGLQLPNGMDEPTLSIDVDSREDAEEALAEMRRDIDPDIRLELSDDDAE